MPRYYGSCTFEGMKDGLLLSEGNCRELQSYIDEHNAKIDNTLRYQSPKADVFSLGVAIYVIMTGRSPFHNSSAPHTEERFSYGDRVRALFEQRRFLNLSDVPFGGIIAGRCCKRWFGTAKEVVAALEVEMGHWWQAGVMGGSVLSYIAPAYWTSVVVEQAIFVAIDTCELHKLVCMKRSGRTRS
ncbi:hypothetical protein P154DRAFT_539922 [Amniculicola lignicola CBS 123094]|uniref:Protein kinase domain-containing protein n=1 Tax=Amniculicola lignicola CBS 123094 TaxID=1392246 RepID=A0A6A5VWB7_9PLEO|nr:hypothetical protein P154DRAFT_539922 [Amniculicola lignicola CBS 123094]